MISITGFNGCAKQWSSIKNTALRVPAGTAVQIDHTASKPLFKAPSGAAVQMLGILSDRGFIGDRVI